MNSYSFPTFKAFYLISSQFFNVYCYQLLKSLSFCICSISKSIINIQKELSKLLSH